MAGPYAGRLADRRGPVLPATAGLAIQVVSLAIYAQLSNTTGLWVVVLASIINGSGPASSLRGALADAFTAGLHAAFYAMMGFMVLAAALSALRAGSGRRA